MTTKKPQADKARRTTNERRRKAGPTQGWFSLEQRAHFKGQKEQA